MNEFIAVIPAREHDDVLPGKNILPFGKTNLLIHKIKQLKKVDQIKKIIVTSESQKYLDMVRGEEIEIDLRPGEFADSKSNFGDFVEYIASKVTAENILWASVTSPMINENDYFVAIEKYKQVINKGYDSLISVNKLKRFLLDENGPLNFRFNFHERSTTKLPTLYSFTNGVVIAPTASMIQWKYNWGEKPYKLEFSPDKTIDICNQAEYEFAKFLYQE